MFGWKKRNFSEVSENKVSDTVVESHRSTGTGTVKFVF
jgi:hypothetical protein